MDRDATRARPKLNLLASRISSVGAMQSPNQGNFGPSFSETAWSIGTNKHGHYMHDCGIVGGRRRHAEAGGYNQNEAGSVISELGLLNPHRPTSMHGTPWADARVDVRFTLGTWH